MPDRRGRTFGVALFIFTLSLVGLALAASWLVRRSFPRTQGLVQLSGLDAEVDIYRSSDGVPYIYASTDHDLFFAQGYVHAQDRFWQMDFNRHVGSGRLSEMFGASQVETDAFLRTLGWRRLAEAELELFDPEVIAFLDAYAEGVNAYLEGRPPTAISLEYAVLRLLHPSYEIEPWTPIHTLTWAKAMAWDLGGNMDGEIDRALLLADLTETQVAELYPPYPSEHPSIVRAAEGAASYQRGDPPPARAELADLRRTRRRLASIDGLLSGGGHGIGSNSWVLAGERTESGGALLANDTHLGIQIPSIWYENALHCRSVTPDCHFNVAGFSFAGAPGVVLGHNDRIAWGLSNVGPDVQDLFIERIHPSDPSQYEFEGEWHPLEMREEEIRVAGQEPVRLVVRETHHGPLISESYAPLEDFTAEAGIELPDSFALALHWTALEPSTLFASLLEVNRAQNWAQFRAALELWDAPSQNFIYADVEGNIGYQMPGKIPVRRQGEGWLPAPGWTGEAEWTGFIPFEELPSAYNPSEGFIVTANNQVIGDDYSYFIERSWDAGYRANRIEELLRSRGRWNAEALKNLQGDNLHPMAAEIAPLLRDLPLATEEHQQWSERLVEWDGHNERESAEAALFNAFWRRLVLNTFADDLPEGPLPQDPRSFLVMEHLVREPQSDWWDDRSTQEIEDRDTIVRKSFEEAFRELERTLGSEANAWRWGSLHTATFRNQSLGQSGVAPIEALFNRGPFGVSGGSSILNATDWDLTEGYEVTSLPSQRLIVDLTDLDDTQSIHTTGQSGHAFHPQYINLAERWRRIEYHPQPWSASRVAAAAAAHLRLAP